LKGGFATTIYRFQLQGTSDELVEPLVLRLFPSNIAEKARLESHIQNALASVGYPTPKVYFTCMDETVLGSCFTVMEFLHGKKVLDFPIEKMTEINTKAILQLHSINAIAVLEALELYGYRREDFSFDSQFQGFIKSVKEKEYDWLLEGIKWIEKNRLEESERFVVCHGDLNVTNILIEDGRVSGVLDWGNFLLGEPEYDLGTLVFLQKVTVPVLIPEIDWSVFDRWIDYYQSKPPLDLERVDFYSTFRCLRAIFQSAQGHAVFGNEKIKENMVNYFHKKTGLMIELP
jgi:aminoglycoside phosphotransferase (APT) family kinase protein